MYFPGFLAARTQHGCWGEQLAKRPSLPSHQGLGQGWPWSTWPDYSFTLCPQFHLGCSESMNDLFIQVTLEWANTTRYLSGNKPAFQR